LFIKHFRVQYVHSVHGVAPLVTFSPVFVA
jgi:hypothetical protein